MDISRREFLKESLAALGFAALPGGFLFAAPPGWKRGGRPNIVFGVVSDTHLRTAHSGNRIGRDWPDKYFVAALEHFKAQGVDAVVHCGDMAHRGQTREMVFHAEAWQRVFGGIGKGPAKLFVTGNHDAEGGNYGGFVARRYPDLEERAKHVLATDMAANWERIWGEPYSDVWHKEVKGCHFFGRNWGAPLESLSDAVKKYAEEHPAAGQAKPCFFLQHRRPLAAVRNALKGLGNTISFFGHSHWSAANWNVIALYGSFPCIQCPSCEPRGCHVLKADAYITKATLGGCEAVGYGRQAYVVRLYDDMMVIERKDFSDGVSSLGADWVMPFGKTPHPFSKGELKKVIGNPQFRKGAKLEVENVANVEILPNANIQSQLETGNIGIGNTGNIGNIVIKIPLADGNPSSRAYAYEVVAVGDEGTPKLHKAVYAAGVNMGIGHETNGGVTTLEIAKDELPPGKSLTFAVRPLSSLGTSGKAIMTTFKV